MVTTSELLVRIDATTSQLRRELRQAETRTATFAQRMDRQMQRVSRGFDAVGRRANDLRAILGGLAAAATLREFVRMSDSLTQLEGRLRLVTDTAEELASVQSSLFRAAQDTRSSFEGTVNLFARVARSTDQLGISNERLVGLVTTVNQAIQTSGATATESEAALIQLSQGLAAGALRGEEFNSVVEQTPRLARAIADGLGVTIGELRELASEGELTAERVITALESQASVIENEFGQLPRTVGQAMQQLRNDLLLVVGDIDETTAAGQRFVGAIDEIRAVITSPDFVSGLATAAEVAATLADNLDLVAVAFSTLIGMRIGAVFGPWGALFGGIAGAVAGLNFELVTVTETLDSFESASNAYENYMEAVRTANVETIMSMRALAAEAQQASIALLEARLSEIATAEARAVGEITLGGASRSLGLSFAESEESLRQQIDALQSERETVSGQLSLAQGRLRNLEDPLNIARVTFGASSDGAADDVRDVASGVSEIADEFIRAGDGAAQMAFELDQLHNRFADIQSEIAAEQSAAFFEGDIERARELNGVLAELRTSYDQQAQAIRDRYTPAASGGASATAAVTEEVEELRETLKKPLPETVEEDLAEIERLGDAVGRSFSSAFEDAILRGGELSDVLAQLALDLARLTLQQQVLGPLTGGIGGFVTSLFGGAAPAIGGATQSVGVAHRGGVVGQLSNSRMVDPAIFTNAQRFHDGGIVGLRPNERPIIAEVGEHVLTEDQRRRIGGGAITFNQTIQVTGSEVNRNGEMDAVAEANLMRQTERMVRAVLRKEMVEQRRVGGINNPI